MASCGRSATNSYLLLPHVQSHCLQCIENCFLLRPCNRNVLLQEDIDDHLNAESPLIVIVDVFTNVFGRSSGQKAPYRFERHLRQLKILLAVRFHQQRLVEFTNGGYGSTPDSLADSRWVATHGHKQSSRCFIWLIIFDKRWPDHVASSFLQIIANVA